MMMQRWQFVHVVFFTIALVLSFASHVAAGAMLTGAAVFSVNSNGSFFNQEYWNTLGGDAAWNLYVTQPNSGIAGSFLNSGDSSSATRVSVALAPGTYTFYTFGQAGSIAGGNPTGYFGLNLFFNSNDTSPGISAYTPTNFAAAPPYPPFLVNSNPSSVTLQITNTSAAGTLAYSDGSFVATLSNFRYSFPTAYNLDRVSPFNNVPNGSNDFVGEFTLTVTALPEPSSLTLMGTSLAGTAALAFVQTRRRHRAASF